VAATTRLGPGGYPLASAAPPLPALGLAFDQVIPAFSQAAAVAVVDEVAFDQAIQAFTQTVALESVVEVSVNQLIPAFNQSVALTGPVEIVVTQTIPAFSQDFEAANLAPPPAPEAPAPHGVIGTPFRPGPIHRLFATVDGVLPPITGSASGFIPLVEGTGAGELRRGLFVADPEIAGHGVGVMRGFLAEGRGEGVIRQFGVGQGRLGMIGGSAKGTVELLTEEEMIAIVLALAA